MLCPKHWIIQIFRIIHSKDPGNHEIEIAFNEEAIPGSPFPCNIIDPSRVIVSGSGLHLVPVGQLATIKVDTNDAGYAPIKATITSPQKTLLPFQIKETAAGECGRVVRQKINHFSKRSIFQF